MSKNLVVFENHELGKIRVIEKNGVVYFVAKDVAEALCYQNSRKAVSDHCKYPKILKGNESLLLTDSPRGITIIPESDLYRLIIKAADQSYSHDVKERAEKYERWVFDEVLPAIRKTGAYVHSEIPVKVSEKFHEASEVFGSYHKVCQLIGCDKNVSAISANQAVNKQFGINFLEDLGQTHLVAVKQEIYFTPTELGKGRGLSGKAFNMILESIGLQRKEGKKWVPTESGLEFCKILDTGKKSGSGVSVTQMKWSEKVLPLVPSIN